MRQPSLRELINKATTKLTAASVDSPRLSAEVLMAHSLGLDTNSLKLRLITEPEKPVSHAEAETFTQLCKQRATGIPVAYLTGVKEFFGLDFAVTPDTLIPRPDTELLVELALATAPAIVHDIAHGIEQNPPQELNAGQHPPSSHTTSSPQTLPLQFADLGTGTGCIAICLALHLPNWQGTAIDISPQALKVARANAQRHQAPNLNFLEASFQSLPLPDNSLHLLVSNPPYISSSHYETLAHEVKDFEPQSALTPGTFGQSSPSPCSQRGELATPPLCHRSPVPEEGHEPSESHQPANNYRTAEYSNPSGRYESNGLEDFYTIIEQAERLLAPRGYLLCEMGFDQGDTLVSYLTQRGWQEIAVHKDLAGHDRVIKARWNTK